MAAKKKSLFKVGKTVAIIVANDTYTRDEALEFFENMGEADALEAFDILVAHLSKQ